LEISVFPASPFWDFSLRLYARRGVADACLRLQGEHGIDVNILFCCLWLGMEGQRATQRDVARMIARVRIVHEQVVKPLRQARTALKRMLATESGDLLPATGAVRGAVKKSELDAEHLEQVMLGALRVAAAESPAHQAGPDLARVNAAAYVAVRRIRLSRRDQADLATILGALESDSVRVTDEVALSPELGRKPPLARAGGGA
jgi:uncharacterized protein (TIGR02444 family)